MSEYVLGGCTFTDQKYIKKKNQQINTFACLLKFQFKKKSEAFYCQVQVTDLDHQYSCSPTLETMQWPASLSIVFVLTLG